MFSSRFRWDLKPNRLTLAREAKRRERAEILDLTQSNPTQAGLVYPDEIAAAFTDRRILRYDPAPQGLEEAREAIARYYSPRGHAVDPGRILLTASTSEAYAYLFKLLCDPGDEVLVPRPSYPLFEFLAAMEWIEARPYPVAYHGSWGIDLNALEAGVTPKTRAIVLVNPNNPTGSFLKRSELDALSLLCRERSLALISDEVFSDYAFGPEESRVNSLASWENCVAFGMSGLSKIAGLPQMKLGWIVVAGPDERRSRIMERLEWIADTYLSVGTPVQCAAARLLAAGESVQRQIRDRTCSNLMHLRATFRGSPATVLPVEGGWYATLQVPRVRTEEEWALELLNRHDVLVQPGFFYDFPSEAFLVLSLLTETAVFGEGVERIAQFVAAS